LHTYSFNDVLVASVLRAMRESFPSFAVYDSNGGDLVVVASPAASLPPLSREVFRLGRVPQYLARIEVRRPEDLAARRVADQDIVRALFATIQVAPNSDYFPIVGTGAAKARFLNEKARAITDMGVAPWPILEMAARGPLEPAYPLTVASIPSAQRLQATTLAALAHDYLLGHVGDSAATKEAFGGFERPLQLFRARFVDCRYDFPAADFWDVAEVVASHVSVYLPPAASSEVWNRVRGSTCFARLTAAQQGWFAVFDALGRRDAAAVVETAIPALAAADSGPQRAYFYGAAMTGLIASRRMDEARALYARYHGRLAPEDRGRGWFRWIEGSVFLAAAADVTTTKERSK